MKKTKTETDKNSELATHQSVDLFSLVFHKTVFLKEQERDRDSEAIRSWLHTHD